MDSNNSGSNSQLKDFLYGSAVYATLAAIAVGMIVITDAEIGPVYVFIGALVAGVFLVVHHFLQTHPRVQRVYDIAFFLSMFVLTTRDITGKLAIVVGACISTIVVSYWLHMY